MNRHKCSSRQSGRAAIAAGFVLALGAPSISVSAQGSQAPSSNEVRPATSIEEIESLGERIYLHDQAAWHASDAIVADIGASVPPPVLGYIVLPTTDGKLETVFFGQNEGVPVARARYRVDGSRVTGGGLVETPGGDPLGSGARRLLEARDTALTEAERREWALCAEARPNIVILGPDANDVVSVYILTPQIDTASYPMGGHFLVRVGPGGEVVSARRYMKTCVPMGTGKAGKDGHAMIAAGVVHVLDPGPTEMHAFVSRYLSIPMLVTTREGQFMIKDGRVKRLGDKGKGASAKRRRERSKDATR